MTNLLNSSPKRGILGIAAASAVLAIAAPVAGASSGGVDPAVYDSGVPAGTVEHGVESLTITGSSQPRSEKIEYWVSGGRFREQTTDAKSGKLIAARIHDASGTTWYSVKGPSGRPFLDHAAGADSIPGPGWPAAYNKKLIAGVEQSNATHSWRLSLAAIGPVTIGQIAGTKYELMTNGHPEEATSRGTQHTYVTLDADAKPLARETTMPNGSRAAFDQTEALVSRESVAAGSPTGARISRVSFKSSLKTWKAAVAKAKKHH